MTKTKESAKEIEELVAQAKRLLNLDSMIDENIIKNMEESFIKQAKRDGEECIEEVIDIVEKALDRIKNPEFKAFMGSFIWAKCPMDMQKECIKYHIEMLDYIMADHIKKQLDNNPSIDIELLKTMLKVIDNE